MKHQPKDPRTESQARLNLVRGVLEHAFFSPLQVNDWPAFLFDQAGLFGLEDDEVFDLLVRGALAAETIYPSQAEGRTPLGWLAAMEDPGPVLAQVLASLRADRPFLFHRVLLGLPGVMEGRLDPGEFELVEDFLQEALEDRAGLREAAAEEWETLVRRARRAAGAKSRELPSAVVDWAVKILARPEPAELGNDVELLFWMESGGGLEGVPDKLAPLVMAEVWRRYTGAITWARPDLELITSLCPQLGLSADELSLFIPAQEKAGHVIKADCPFCQATTAVKLGDKVQKLSSCPHLIYLGTNDEAHLWEVLRHFALGDDFHRLLSSYYASPADLELFATIVNDLYEMLQGDDRLATVEVQCETAAHGFYFLRAYFADDPRPQPSLN